MGAMKGRILVVDDDTALSEMLGIVLRGEGFEPFCAPTGTGRWRPSRSSTPTWCCWTSCCRAGTASRSAARSARSPGCRSSCSPPRATRSTSCSGLESGADDYVVKPFKPKELVARIRARMRRTDDGRPETLEIGDLIDRRARSHGQAGRRGDLALTPLEFDLLVALARKPWQVFTREMLLEQVWGYRHAADTRLVNVHVQRLRSKIERDPEHPEIVVTVRGVGLQGRSGLGMDLHAGASAAGRRTLRSAGPSARSGTAGARRCTCGSSPRPWRSPWWSSSCWARSSSVASPPGSSTPSSEPPWSRRGPGSTRPQALIAASDQTDAGHCSPAGANRSSSRWPTAARAPLGCTTSCCSARRRRAAVQLQPGARGERPGRICGRPSSWTVCRRRRSPRSATATGRPVGAGASRSARRSTCLVSAPRALLPLPAGRRSSRRWTSSNGP